MPVWESRLAAAKSSQPEAAERFRTWAGQALRPNVEYHSFKSSDDVKSVERVQSQLNKELAEARQWYQQIEADEARWIREGLDVDREFARKYYDSLDETIVAAEKTVAAEPDDTRTQQSYQASLMGRALAVLAGIITVLVATVWGIVQIVRK